MKAQELPVIYHEKAKTLWILDSGHGFDTPGKRSPIWDDCTQLMEWKFNRQMTELIYTIGREYGLKMHILVQEDYDVSLRERVARQKAIKNNSQQPCILISNHANAAGAESASGIEVFTSVGQTASDSFAEIVLNELFRSLNTRKRRTDQSDGDLDKEAQFYILRNTSCPAILIEYGFMTNEEECRLLFTTKFQETAAMAVVNAMLIHENIN